MDDPRSTSGARIGGLAILMIVLLRMTIGGHFLNEGMKKLEPGFSSAGFLQNAKGPLAPFFRSFAPTFHEWDQLLATPRQSPEYVGYKPSAEANLPPEALRPTDNKIHISPDDPAGNWGNRILHDWEQMVAEFAKTPGLSEQQQKDAEAVFAVRAKQVKDYLNEANSEISDYRHELWRMAEWDNKKDGRELPFLESRIAGKRAETSGTPRKWVADVEQMELGFASELRELLTEEQHDSALAMKHVEATLKPNTWLPIVDRSIKVIIIGSGLCLLFGFFTRLGAVAAAAFLLSVMATQPPWVPGAELTWFQPIEFLALLTLATVGAGRWAGIDAMIHHRRDSQPSTTKAPAKSA